MWFIIPCLFRVEKSQRWHCHAPVVLIYQSKYFTVQKILIHINNDISRFVDHQRIFRGTELCTKRTRETFSIHVFGLDMDMDMWYLFRAIVELRALPLVFCVSVYFAYYNAQKYNVLLPMIFFPDNYHFVFSNISLAKNINRLILHPLPSPLTRSRLMFGFIN